MYIQKSYFSTSAYLMIKIGGQIIDSVKKVKTKAIDRSNKIPTILNKESNSIDYFVFNHHFFSKKFINKDLSFKDISKKLEYLKKKKII